MVSRRIEERAEGAHRVRAPVRAHDVPGLEERAAGEYFSYVERAGANLQEGGVNGTTSSDRTNYFATVPSGNLENILWLESDRLATLLDATDLKKLDNQRDVVKNERRQGLENQPYGRWYPLALEAVFPAGHPYNWPVIGSQEDLTAASLTDVQEFFRRYYTPNNLSLVIAGDFDPAEAKRLVEKYFGVIPPGPALDRPARWVPVMNGEKIVEVSDRVPQDRTYMVWPAPAYFTDDEAALNLATLILTDGLSSRLNKALVYDKQLCSAVASFPIIMEIGGAFVVQATARPGVTLAQIEAVVTDEIARLAKTGPTAAELERASRRSRSSGSSPAWKRSADSAARRICSISTTPSSAIPASSTKTSRATAASASSDVRAAVDKYLNTRNRALLRFHPEASGRPSQTTLDRTKAPALGEDRAFKVPEVKTATLDNGLQIFVVERSELPKVSVTLGSRAGAAADPADKPGLANMVVRTIDMGTKTRQALRDRRSARRSRHVARRRRAARVLRRSASKCSRVNLPAALGIVSDVVRNASFPETEVAREKKRQLDSIAQQDKNPNQVAARVRAMLAYRRRSSLRPSRAGHREIRRGDDARRPRGLPSRLLEARRLDADLRRQRHARRSHQTRDAALRLVERRRAARTDHPRAASRRAAGKIYLIDRQDSAQTVVSQFMPASKRKSDDVYAFKLADAVWGGGGFGTRLNLNLREDKGYSYGVFSTLSQFTRRRPVVRGRRRADEQDQGIDRRVRQGTQGARRRQADLAGRIHHARACAGFAATPSSSKATAASAVRFSNCGARACR